MSDKCQNCGSAKQHLKMGWTNCMYCSEECEREHVSAVHGSMPDSGGVPRQGWVPDYVSREINNRWKTNQ